MSEQTRFKTVAEEIPDAPHELREKLYFGGFDADNPFDMADLNVLIKFINTAGMGSLARLLDKNGHHHLLLQNHRAIIELVTPLYEMLVRGDALDPQAREAAADEYIAEKWSEAPAIDRLRWLEEAGEPTKHVLEEDAPPIVTSLIYRRIGEL